MALDGFFIHAHVKTLNTKLEGLKIEKIYQLNPTDLLISFRGQAAYKLFLSANANHPRFLLVDDKPEMPSQPPMFCMLLRKHIQGATLEAISQVGLERIITLTLRARNDLGDTVEKKLIIEIMGKHSNIIMVDDHNQVIDSIKRVSPHMSSRPIGPGTPYLEPPTTKISLAGITQETLVTHLLHAAERDLFKNLYMTFEGLSPALAKSICYQANIGHKTATSSLAEGDYAALYQAVVSHLKTLSQAQPLAIMQGESMVDFSAVTLEHMVDVRAEVFPTYDEVLTTYYSQQKATNPVAQGASDLIKTLSAAIDKLSKKIDNLNQDLETAAQLETLRLYGELLTANLYQLKKGMASVEVINYYDGQAITIDLDVTKGPNDNAQAYYKKYNKSKKTLDQAQRQKDMAIEERRYLDQVKVLLEQAETPEDIDLIKEELRDMGMVLKTKKKQKPPKRLPPHKYHSSEGVTILVGRNNLQNDELTLKTAYKDHIWLHTKEIPGSHVIIQAEFPDIEDQTIIEAAQIAAYHSKGRQSSQVAVDFTEVKYVKKPKGSKPGMVIYEDYKTLYVTPDETTIKSLKQKTPD